MQIRKEFKDFAMHGNIVDMAVGIDIAFGKIVSSLVVDVVMTPIGVALDGFDFMIVAFAVFIVIKALNKLKKIEDEKPVEPPKSSAEEKLLTEIRDLFAKN